ncbi:hypothetical protein TSAR_015795 [Trichomalopsis sarcophagae]|uniref:poly(ADP-ribose) glycohydrolase n=1 Tax=Trichomalopsis sarcophagae TaxID=543379 RepID=A0A232FE57_9HYME|nr:hypothetical protein TSAR_015795 [Trichomalopsis sarcophagae]
MKLIRLDLSTQRDEELTDTKAMALVMLPCDLPWWSAVTKQLDRAAAARTSADLVDAMQRLHEMCNISLDPEEDIQEPDLFVGLARYLDEDLSSTEREHVLTKSIPRIASQAKALKTHKPPQGLHFSLQQQGDTVEHSYAFVASLIANAFFSTYPKRTPKTHPTLKDFNFTNFFKHLHLKSQKAKLRGIFQYFDYLDSRGEKALDGNLLISRQILPSRQWLTIEDWLESSLPLCPLTIRHEGRLERAEHEAKAAMQVCFTSRSFGNGVLEADVTQETIQIATHPEMLAVMLSVEALEDNEALIIEGLRHISRIQDPKHRATFEAIPEPNTIMVCCIDADDYSKLPLSQYEEDNVLRELNKSLLGFRQRRPPQSPTENDRQDGEGETGPGTRRLSPIGESFSSASPEIDESARKCHNAKINSSGSQASAVTESSETGRTRGNGSSTRAVSPGRVLKVSSTGRRNRFIVLGSSGEALPVTRKSIAQTSVYDSCNSQSTDSFHSAKDTIDEEPENEEEDQKQSRRYSAQLDTPERRGTFAQRLIDALKRESSATGTTSTTDSTSESSYAVGISIAGSQVADQNIKVKRGGSRGFMLRDETVDEEFLKESLEAEQKWLGRFRQSQPAMMQRKEAGASSRYSFSTEYSSDFCSEMDEVYEQLSKWLEDPIVPSNETRELDARDKAVVTFAGSLLKRALSESFAGVPVQEGEPQPLFDSNDVHQRRKLALAVRSLSLELARQRSRNQPMTNDGRNRESDDEETFVDAPQGDPKMFRDARKSQRRKLMAVTFTSELFQTLSEDEAIITLPSRKSTKNKKVPLPRISRESSPQDGGLLPVATGNWGCGSRLKGDPQLKLVIQWLAASLAGAPRLIYYTFGHSTLTKLDTVSRVLTDRQWSVGDLAAVALRFSVQTIEKRLEGRNSLFEELIGMDKPSP